jgi:hypothetical protein
MKHIASNVLAIMAGVKILFGVGVANAQTIAAGAQANPDRIVNHQDLGPSTRPANLQPTGINFSDCFQDMTLQYSVILSGFPGANNDSMQVWASIGADCSNDMNRGYQVSSEAAECWLVAELPPTNIGTPTPYTFKIPVRALVGITTNTIPKAGTLVGDMGIEACYTQTVAGGDTINVYFLPVTPMQTVDTGGSYYQAPAIPADLVGPAPPQGVTIKDGDTLFVVSWIANNDSETAGYDVFIDPPPGSAPAEAGLVSVVPVNNCPDTGTEASAATTDAATSSLSTDAEPSIDSEASGSNDATAVPTDATTTMGTTEAGPDSASSGSSGCAHGTMAVTPATNGSSTCTSLVLTMSSMVADSGVGTSVLDSVDATEADSSSSTSEDSSVAATTGGGITTIPCDYLVGSSCPAGTPVYENVSNPTVTGESTSQYTIKGLTNGVTYDVVVAAVDGFGNVGPVSTCYNDYPAPVNDFFKIYRQDGGQAGGGFCALEAVGEPAGASCLGVSFAAAAVTVARRRRRGRR